jgi:hypothetical protein
MGDDPWIGLKESPTGSNSAPTSILPERENCFANGAPLFALGVCSFDALPQLVVYARTLSAKNLPRYSNGETVSVLFPTNPSTARTYYRRTSIPGPRVYGHAKNNAVPSPHANAEIVRRIEKSNAKGERENDSNASNGSE